MKPIDVPNAAAARQETSPLQLVLYIMYNAFCFVLALVVVPLLLPLLLVCRLYRKSLRERIEEETDGDAIIATADDSVWFQEQPTNMAIINSIMFVKGECNAANFQDIILQRLINAKDENGDLLAAKMSRYATKMYHRDVWLRDETFDIKNHVHMWQGDMPKNKKELEVLCGDLCSKHLPKDRSLWEMIIIPCFNMISEVNSPDDDAGDVFPIIFRVHHAIGDGGSLMRLLMQQLFELDIKGKQQIPKKFTSKGIYMRILKSVFTGPGMIISRLFWPTKNHILHGPVVSGHKNFTWSDNMDLKLIKRMKNATGTTVNDILMTCLAGAFHEYFKAFASHNPDDILTYVPVDIRSPSAKFVLDNQFALVYLKLPVNISDRLERLAETKARMENIKQSAEPLVNALIIRYLMSRFPSWVTRILFDSLASKCSLVLSNVPGPQEPCYVDGLRLEQMVFWPPQRCTVGMGISILSYNGTVKTGIMMDKQLCTNPRLLLVEFEKEVKAMATELKVLEEVQKQD